MKFRSYIPFLLLTMMLQSCLLVWDKEYRSNKQENKRYSEFVKEDLKLRLSIGNPETKGVLFDLNFNDGIKHKVIKNLTVQITPDNGQDLHLDRMYIYQSSSPISVDYNDAKYKSSSFGDLDENLRVTTFKGSGVHYLLCYKSSKWMRAKSVNLSLLIEYDGGGKLELKDDFLFHKDYYWAPMSR